MTWHKFSYMFNVTFAVLKTDLYRISSSTNRTYLSFEVIHYLWIISKLLTSQILINSKNTVDMITITCFWFLKKVVAQNTHLYIIIYGNRTRRWRTRGRRTQRRRIMLIDCAKSIVGQKRDFLFIKTIWNMFSRKFIDISSSFPGIPICGN